MLIFEFEKEYKGKERVALSFVAELSFEHATVNLNCL